MTGKIRILVVDDHPFVREGLRAVITAEADMEVVGEAADGRAAIREAAHLRPDVVVMDLLMPVIGGEDAIAAILAENPAQAIVVLTTVDDLEALRRVVRLGALGYVSKNAPPAELLAAIRTVHRGGVALPAAIARALLAAPAPLAAEPTEPLTPREKEILALVAEGLSNNEIAQRLVISPSTVSVHISHILGKLGLENRVQLALYVHR